MSQTSEFSLNEEAEAVMGRRLTAEQEQTGVVAIDLPCELGYWCPVCRVEWDEALDWSEYASFLWCARCNVDYPSALCVPLESKDPPDRTDPWSVAGVEDAVEVFLRSVKTAQKRVVDETSHHLAHHAEQGCPDCEAILREADT